MVRIPKLLEEMAERKITPNVVTYSSVLKGYCQETPFSQAVELGSARVQCWANSGVKWQMKASWG